jgi:hypothetical protein
MQLPKLALSLPLFLAVVTAPAVLRAQFQQPSSEELKMTEDPKAPGAAAVYLYREEVTDDASRSWTYYERIKILTEKGRELATVHIPFEHGYDKVADVQGRTIHSDGTAIPLTSKPDIVMDYKVKGFQLDTVVFTLPSVEVGSILEYRLMIRPPENPLSRPVWEIQQAYFVHKAHYSFHPHTMVFSGIYDSNGPVTRINYSQRLGPGMSLNYSTLKDTYSIDLTDIPPLPKEDWMPPLNTLKWRVEFYFTNSMTGPAFWADAGRRWATFVDEFTNPTSALKKAAADMVAPTDSDEQKARKIYAAVEKLDNTSFSREKSEAERKKEKIREIQTAEDVWKDQSGSDDQIALLYVALGRAAGLKVWPVYVVDRNRAIFDNSFLSVRQLNDYLAIVEIDGKDVYIDPGQKMCPFGQLSWKHNIAGGFRLTAAGATPVLTPSSSYKAAEVDRVAQLFIDATGAVTGSVRFIMNGPDALHWRQLTLKNDPDEVKKQFNESMQNQFPEGVQADFDHFLALDDYTVNLIGVVKVTGNIATSTGKRVFLPGVFFEAQGRHPFVAQEKRTTPIDVHYAKLEEDDVTYHLPPGLTVESAPQATSAAWPDHALLKIASEATADSVNVTRTLAYGFTLVEPKDYGNLHDFYQKVATADQQQLVLTRTPAANGN